MEGFIRKGNLTMNQKGFYLFIFVSALFGAGFIWYTHNLYIANVGNPIFQETLTNFTSWALVKLRPLGVTSLEQTAIPRMMTLVLALFVAIGVACHYWFKYWISKPVFLMGIFNSALVFIVTAGMWVIISVLYSLSPQMIDQTLAQQTLFGVPQKTEYIFRATAGVWGICLFFWIVLSAFVLLVKACLYSVSKVSSIGSTEKKMKTVDKPAAPVASRKSRVFAYFRNANPWHSCHSGKNMAHEKVNVIKGVIEGVYLTASIVIAVTYHFGVTVILLFFWGIVKYAYAKQAADDKHHLNMANDPEYRKAYELKMYEQELRDRDAKERGRERLKAELKQLDMDVKNEREANYRAMGRSGQRSGAAYEKELREARMKLW
ncbi:hypothetical protein EKG38_10685 [Shewanella canadensis]|uniref:Uncharacterized protein n=1 Tax=Shewanella canadensis TaxID=271096 RepID=A0A431WSH0_9GAMM|nr:OmpH family outer membrane protein [Shewanella canadensis]RTR38638.1 hypothetical protein EKG38_10685 [Shewanella canadensis]